jgi:hypothetical protein
MVVYRCDGCGKEMPSGALRYVVTVETKAAYEELTISLRDLVRDHRREILALLDRMRHMSPEELEAQVYTRRTFDLCPACHARFIRAPLRFAEAGEIPNPPFDVDSFLRSLGYGGDKD